MTKNISFTHKIDPLWDAVKQIRNKVEASLKNECSQELCDASKMTASELIENAVKHGSAVDNGEGIHFEFVATEKQIKVTAANKVQYKEDFETLQCYIDKINGSDDPQELYLERLKMLMDNTRLVKTQLGLFRIAYEGEFTLDYNFEDNILTVIAIRDI